MHMVPRTIDSYIQGILFSQSSPVGCPSPPIGMANLSGPQQSPGGGVVVVVLTGGIQSPGLGGQHKPSLALHPSGQQPIKVL